jgi:hypothetical protein
MTTSTKDKKLMAGNTKAMEPYCTFLSQLRFAHFGSSQLMDDKEETLLSDIQKAPLNFCTDMRSVITHSILLLGVVKPNNLMQNHDPSVA